MDLLGVPWVDIIFSEVFPLQQWFCRTTSPKKVAEEKQKVCEDRKQDHRDKKEGCDKFQSQFESGFCVWRTEMIDVCNAQETCYDAARNAYDAHVKSTQMLVQKWKIEYTALKKILCYVNVWFDKDNHATVAGGEDTDVEHEKLETCKSLGDLPVVGYLRDGTGGLIVYDDTKSPEKETEARKRS